MRFRTMVVIDVFVLLALAIAVWPNHHHASLSAIILLPRQRRTPFPGKLLPSAKVSSHWTS